MVPSLALAAYLALFDVTPNGVGATPHMLTVGRAHLPLLPFPVPRLADEPGGGEALQGLIRYRGPAVLADGRTTYRTFAANKLLASENLLLNDQKPLVDPAEFRDAVVFVGVTAAGGFDVFQTPLGSTGRIPGSQVHGTIVDQLMTGRTLDRVSAAGLVAVTLAAALAVAALTVPLRLTMGAPGTLFTGAGVGAAGLAAFA